MVHALGSEVRVSGQHPGGSCYILRRFLRPPAGTRFPDFYTPKPATQNLDKSLIPMTDEVEQGGYIRMIWGITIEGFSRILKPKP